MAHKRQKRNFLSSAKTTNRRLSRANASRQSEQADTVSTTSTAKKCDVSVAPLCTVEAAEGRHAAKTSEEITVFSAQSLPPSATQAIPDGLPMSENTLDLSITPVLVQDVPEMNMPHDVAELGSSSETTQVSLKPTESTVAVKSDGNTSDITSSGELDNKQLLCSPRANVLPSSALTSSDDENDLPKTGSTAVTSPERSENFCDTNQKEHTFSDLPCNPDKASIAEPSLVSTFSDTHDGSNNDDAPATELGILNQSVDSSPQDIPCTLAAELQAVPKTETSPIENSRGDSVVITTEVSEARQQALCWKDKGNAFLQRKCVKEAISAYTQGIELDPTYHILYSNRSAAYCMDEGFAAALSDADECLRLAPSFSKGHSRRATALLQLKKPVEAFMAAKDALKLQQDAGDERGSIVKAIMQDAQREILERILLGAWMGTVDPLFGGYEQLFEYKAENPKLICTVLHRSTNVRYTLYPQAQPMAMDITAEAAFSIEPYLIPPTVPYIFRLFYIRHGENETRTELRLDHDSVSALNSLSHNGCVTNGDPSVSWEMELCAPYMAVARPTEFFGPGFVVMRKLTNEEFKQVTSNTIDPSLEALSFDEQLSRYFEEVLGIVPEQRLEEPDMQCDQDVAAAKIALLMREQSRVFKITKRFPDTVSAVAEQLLRQSPSPANSGSNPRSLDPNPIIREESLSQKCQTLLHRVRDHIQTTGLECLQFSIASQEMVSQEDAFASSPPLTLSKEPTPPCTATGTGAPSPDVLLTPTADFSTSSSTDHTIATSAEKETASFEPRSSSSSLLRRFASWLGRPKTLCTTSFCIALAATTAWYLISTRHRRGPLRRT